MASSVVLLVSKAPALPLVIGNLILIEFITIAIGIINKTGR